MGTNITGIGNANAIGFKSRVTGGAYFPPELKGALVGVWSAYGKSNDSTDRNIIKNKIKDKGGDFVISNAAFKLNSGFGKYEVDFTSWIQTDGVIASSDKVQNSIIGRFLYFNTVNKKEDVPSFKVNITLGQQSKLQYNYIKEDGTTTYIVYSESGIYTIPASYFSKYTGGNAWFGFYQIEGTSIIEQIPSFEGAFVTDGIDDQIVSTKTIQEMLGGSNEITVVSMIHLVQTPAASSEKAYTNQIRTGQNYLRNYVTDNGKTGIYGYTCKGNNVSVINNILGDKNDYTVENKSWNNLAKFSVIGYEDNGTINELDQVAWYWTFIANRVLTEDEINLVIEKYNLDRPGEIVKPQVYYNVKKQKISNDNHSAFDDKLIDYSGNGYDAKLYNFGWKEDSGIGKYETDFTDWKKSFKVTSFDSESIKFTSDASWVLLYHPSSIGEDIPSFKVRIKLYGKGTLYYNYITQEGKYTNVAVKSEIFETPICYNTKYTGEKGVNVGFTLGVISGECSGTITQIPEYENALVLDGVDDYGKVAGLPILKDYTFLVDRQIINIGDVQRIVASKSESATDTAKQGAFLFEYLSKNSISTWSYYENNPLVANADFNRDISYQSKYIYNGKDLTIGTSKDSDKLWLGTIRDRDSRFFNGAIYLLMLFPYSMSEFLIERQIEKVKGGTLYPNQVEFRPIIPEDENITKIDYFVVNSGTWTIIKPGDYVDVGARIVFNIYTKLPYKVAGVSSTSFTGMSIRPSTGLNIFDVQGYIKDKTPQKIKLTLAVNEDIIQWNPTISANIPDSYDAVTEWFANGWETKIAVGDWIKKSDRIFFKLKLKEPLHEIGKVTFGGSECQATKASNWSESNNLWEIVTYSSVGDLSQVFNVQVDEYIRYEDIVQPYPSLLRFNDGNGNEVSWGGKFKVGSTITRIGSAADSNLLPNIYNIFGLLLNGNQVTSSKVIVEKTMVFKAKSAYIFDNNEPKCILSPRLLRIPNSSYKILGHIPDISGHGNNGKINNSAYEGMSGVNGYPYDYNNSSFWADSSLAKVVSGELVEYFAVKNSTGFSNITSGVYKGKIKVTGVTKAISENKISRLRIYSNSTTDNELIDITQDGNYNIDIKGVDDANRVSFYAIPSNPNDTAVVRLTEPIYIEQVGNYEGSICFDGVDDYVDIPSLSIGGKQVLMKTNWLKSPTLLYDQRASGSFAILTTKEDDATNPRIAYQARNQDGKTYIDGIENNYIETYSLKGITHNITVTNPSAGSGVVPVIGANTGKSSSFAKMALYDFMLFDEVSTDEEIKQLNDIVGIEGGYVQKPPYYWDAYGKTNSDDDRSTIQQRGTAVGDYDITNYNHAYEGMSGYNGYPAVFGTNKTYANLVPNDGNFILTSSHNIINVTKFDTSYGLLYSHIKLDGKLTSRNIDYPSYKIKVTGLGENFGLHYSYLESSSDTTVKGFEINNDGIYIIPKSFASDGSLTSNSDWIGFIFTGTAPESCNVTIEVLPEYENGLVYDGVDDYSENTSIPAFTDYTYIIKYEDFNNPNTGSCIQRKGSIKAGGGAFVQDHIYRGTKYQYNFGISSNIHKDDSIAFCTKTNYNGTAIPSGNNTDDTGFTIGKFDGYRKMVFYKEMLYPRTVNMLTINMIKNMMAEDGIIDIQGKLFTDKFTGDFNLDFNKDFLIGN